MISVTAAAIALSTGTINASIIYYDGLDYGATSGPLAGRNGGNGFSGAWRSWILGLSMRLKV
jgi:hypothetical protein